MKVWIDGKYYDKADAKVSVYDHGLLYGDGIFEGIRIYNGKIFRLDDHLARLRDSAKALALDIPMSRGDLAAACEDAVRVNEKKNGYVRLVVTRGVGDLGVSPYTCPKATVIIIVDDITLYPAEYYESGIAIVTASSRRMPVDALDPRIKSLNYLNNVMAKIEARQAGCLEAVMLNREGYVSECTGDNVFVVKAGKLYSPASACASLEGITRRTVFELAGELGIESAEATLTRYDLYVADECFLTGTGAEVIPVTKIDGRVIGEGRRGPVTKSILELFRKRVQEA
jgi:branched-chain amino acid aminotransferase